MTTRRKLLWVTAVLVPTVAKADILTAAIASAWLGADAKGPVVGFSDAAQRYYSRPLSGPDDRQFLSLVAMLPSPRTLDPAPHPAANTERVRRIERLLSGACAPAGRDDVMLEGCRG